MLATYTNMPRYISLREYGEIAGKEKLDRLLRLLSHRYPHEDTDMLGVYTGEDYMGLSDIVQPIRHYIFDNCDLLERHGAGAPIRTPTGTNREYLGVSKYRYGCCLYVLNNPPEYRQYTKGPKFL